MVGWLVGWLVGFQDVFLLRLADLLARERAVVGRGLAAEAAVDGEGRLLIPWKHRPLAGGGVAEHVVVLGAAARAGGKVGGWSGRKQERKESEIAEEIKVKQMNVNHMRRTGPG